MSLNSLKIATDGYLKRQTKAVLIIAVAGYLNFQGTPVPPPISPADGTEKKKTYDEDTVAERSAFLIKQQEQDIIDVIKTFVQCQ